MLLADGIRKLKNAGFDSFFYIGDRPCWFEFLILTCRSFGYLHSSCDINRRLQKVSMIIA